MKMSLTCNQSMSSIAYRLTDENSSRFIVLFQNNYMYYIAELTFMTGNFMAFKKIELTNFRCVVFFFKTISQLPHLKSALLFLFLIYTMAKLTFSLNISRHMPK